MQEKQPKKSIDLHGTIGIGNGCGAKSSGISKKVRGGTATLGNPYSLNGTCGIFETVISDGPMISAWVQRTIAANTTNSFYIDFNFTFEKHKTSAQ